MKIGLTENFPCQYLRDQQERIAIAVEEHMQCTENYALLLANGFRRSGSMIYRPYCEQCHACQSIRVVTPNFQPSRSQRTLLKKASKLRWVIKNKMDDSWFDLYAHYITERHCDGAMFPPQKENFSQFAECSWLNIQYLHVYDQDRLIAIAVTDILPESASAFYTFYDPNFELSLGTLCVLFQLEYCQSHHKHWLYLGYQVDECSAMNYKVRFQPHQKLVNQRWQE